MIFHRILPGKFKMGKNGVDAEITSPFEMISTEVTQIMWAQLKIIMGETDLNKINPANFNEGSIGQKVKIENYEIPMRPNNPVEQVSWDEVHDFINSLNLLTASLDTKVQQTFLNIIESHQPGYIYDLPTEAEWEFVMRNRGQANRLFFDCDDISEVSHYAWFNQNAGNQTHPVATKKPRLVDDQPFYDLEGNVWEWCKDWYDDTLHGGRDPQGPSTGKYRVIRGGSWFYNIQNLCADDRGYYKPSERYNNIGFRLVRRKI